MPSTINSLVTDYYVKHMEGEQTLAKVMFFLAQCVVRRYFQLNCTCIITAISHNEKRNSLRALATSRLGVLEGLDICGKRVIWVRIAIQESSGIP